MKTKLFFPGRMVLTIPAVLLGCVMVAQASPAAANEAARPAAPGAAAPDNSRPEPEPPKSVFTIPRAPQEGRDPFFPNSKRLFFTPIPRPPDVVQKAELHLKGISGPAGKRLAIVNNNTFGQGESGDVNTPSGRVHIRCLEIKNDSVIIEIGPERRELRMRNGF